MTSVTGLQLAIGFGVILGAGLALALWRIIPANPELGDAIDRLSPAQQKRPRAQSSTGEVPASVSGTKDRLGVWGMKHLPSAVWSRTPQRELAIQHIPVHRFYGEKIFYCICGLLFPPLFTALLAIGGFSLPLPIPLLGSLILAAVMFVLPDVDARAGAKRSRGEFNRSLGAYIDLVALEVRAGAGPRQALESAAATAAPSNWVFRRLHETLSRSAIAGQAPWDALRELADEIGLPPLRDLADTLRLSGGTGAQSYQHLRARAAAMRDQITKDEQAKANAVSERMTIPMSLLGVVFLVMIITPAILGMLEG